MCASLSYALLLFCVDTMDQNDFSLENKKGFLVQ